MILRCTSKILKELGLSKSKLTDVSGNEALFNEWYAHLFYLHRRKCVMFTHAGSLFSFVVHGVVTKDLKNLNEFFRKELSRALYYENFSADQIRNLLDHLGQIELAPTASRSVLGSMNELIYQYSYMKSDGTEPAEIVTQLNRIPMQPFKLGYPIERFQRNIEPITGVSSWAEKKDDQGNKITKTQVVYIFDVRMIQYAEGQEIWRQVAVSGNKSLSHLAEVILGAFDFECDHCYGFYGDVNKHPGREQTETYELFVDIGEETIAENAKGVQRTKISSVFVEAGKRMLFVFDYGEDWRFQVELKDVKEEFGEEQLPKVLANSGQAPLQYPPLKE